MPLYHSPGVSHSCSRYYLRNPFRELQSQRPEIIEATCFEVMCLVPFRRLLQMLCLTQIAWRAILLTMSLLEKPTPPFVINLIRTLPLVFTSRDEESQMNSKSGDWGWWANGQMDMGDLFVSIRTIRCVLQNVIRPESRVQTPWNHPCFLPLQTIILCVSQFVC